MTFTTKFDIGQEVFLLSNNKVVTAVVRGISVGAENGCRYVPQYRLSVDNEYKCHHYESDLYATKEELITGLMKG